MSPLQPLRVRFDGTAFMLHRRSGISRYFAELVSAFDADPALGIVPVTPYRYITSVHARHIGRGLRSLPLPRSVRMPVLDRANRRWSSSAHYDLTHYPLYGSTLIDEAEQHSSVTTVYDFTFETMPHLFGDVSHELEVKRRFFEACDGLVCISETTARDLRHFHPDLDKPVAVTPLAVAEKFFSAGTRRVKGFPERYLLHVGNRAEHKNVDLLLRAFKSLASIDPTLHLVLCGQGLPGESEHLDRLGIADRTLVTRVSDANLPAAYRHALAFVFPSRYEGFGLPVLEAMATGCPTLVSDTPALIEVADNAADVVAPDDLDGAVSVLQRLIGDAEHIRLRRSSGRARARQFTWHDTAARTRAAYHQVAESRG